MSEPTLASLRAQGAQHHDPVRFRYLEVLAARLPGQPQAVQQLLVQRLEEGVRNYAQRAAAAQGAQPPAARDGTHALPSPSPSPSRSVAALPPPPSMSHGSPLAQLNRHLNARAALQVGAGASATMAPSTPGGPPVELNSVRRFGEVWARISAEKQVVQAFTRGPENAGPLNAHRLLLRSLALMRALSPGYLQHFVLHADSLLWLEQSAARPARTPLKPGRAGRGGKA